MAATRHKISWFVYAAPSERIPRQATMRGHWNYDATCTCGWDSRTGGALRRHVADLVADHKADAYDEDLMRRTPPIWTEERGTVLRWVLAVYRDDDPDSTEPFLAAAKSTSGVAAVVGRRATLDEAIAHADTVYATYLA